MQLHGLADQTSSHLHAGGIGDNGSPLVSMPLGSFSNFLFQDDSAATVINQILAGKTYINIHRPGFPAGGSGAPM
jgi:hypothetical protein